RYRQTLHRPVTMLESGKDAYSTNGPTSSSPDQAESAESLLESLESQRVGNRDPSCLRESENGPFGERAPRLYVPRNAHYLEGRPSPAGLRIATRRRSEAAQSHDHSGPQCAMESSYQHGARGIHRFDGPYAYPRPASAQPALHFP